MTLEKPTRKESDLYYPTAPEAPAAVTPPKKHWVGRCVAAGLLLLVVVAALLPQILSTDAFRQQLAASFLDDFEGQIQIGEADLAWWKPAEITSMTMVDQEGEPLAKIASAKVSSPLWHMLWPGKQPLELKISRPEIVYEIDQYGRTNWERVFSSLNPKKTSKLSWPDFRHNTQPLHIKVTEGKVVLKDRVSKRIIEADHIEAKLLKSMKLIEGELTGQTQLQTDQAEKLPGGIVEANFQLAMADNKIVAGDVDGKIKKTPLEMIQPWIKQALPHLHLTAGNTDGDFKSKWTGDLRSGFKLAVSGNLQATEVKARSSKWSAGNELMAAELTSQFRIDNTLPTAPGAFDVEIELTEGWFVPLPPQLREDQGEGPPPETLLKRPIELGAVSFQTTGEIDVINQRLNLTKCDFVSDPCNLHIAGEVKNFTSAPYLDLEGKGTGDITPYLTIIFPKLSDILKAKRLTPEEFAIKGTLPAFQTETEATAAAPPPAVKLGEPVEVSPQETLPVPQETAENPTREDAPAPSDPNLELPVPTPPTPPAPLSAVAKWNWEMLEVYGISSQSGGLWTRYEDQQLDLVPMKLLVGKEGEFLAKSRIDFREDQRILTIQKGTVLQNVDFNEKMCRTWLKYLSPVFADATDLEGKFSLALGDTVFDLKTGLAKQLEGQLLIDHCQLGPGPLVQKAIAPLRGFLNITARPEGGVLQPGAKWIVLPKQQVLFKKENNRIYHDQLVFQTGPVSVVSTGSVGDDQTLDMAILIPLNFFKESAGPVAKAIEEKPIEIHVTGTLSKPEVDGSQIANFSKQFGINALDGLIQGIRERRQQRRESQE